MCVGGGFSYVRMRISSHLFWTNLGGCVSRWSSGAAGADVRAHLVATPTGCTHTCRHMANTSPIPSPSPSPSLHLTLLLPLSLHFCCAPYSLSAVRCAATSTRPACTRCPTRRGAGGTWRTTSLSCASSSIATASRCARSRRSSRSVGRSVERAGGSEHIHSAFPRHEMSSVTWLRDPRDGCCPLMHLHNCPTHPHFPSGDMAERP